MSATQITIGNIVSAGGIFGPEQFGSSAYGSLAFFDDLNTRGGINGRRVIERTYNDNGSGSDDVSAVKQAINTDKVFAFVGNNIYQYDGAPYVSSSGTPDIGGQPIHSEYYRYPHLYNFYGYNGPQDGTNYGYSNNNYYVPDYATYFTTSLHVKLLGVVHYDIPGAARAAAGIENGFKQLGVPFKEYPVNLGLPNFANTVAQMQSDGIDLVADSLDSNGNAKLCQAMEGNSSFLAQVKAKVSTIATWSQRVPTEYKQTPKCRALLYSTGSTIAYSQTSNPDVASFRAAMQKYYPTRANLLSQWTFEGWLAAELFTDAATSCGANLTRACVEAYITKPGFVFDPHGTTIGFSWYKRPQSDFQGKTKPQACTSVARWSDAENTFVSVADPSTTCYPNLPYFTVPTS